MAAAAKALLSVLDYLDVDGFAGLTALLCHPGLGALAEAVPTKARGTRQFKVKCPGMTRHSRALLKTPFLCTRQ